MEVFVIQCTAIQSITFTISRGLYTVSILRLGIPSATGVMTIIVATWAPLNMLSNKKKVCSFNYENFLFIEVGLILIHNRTYWNI